MVPTRKTGPSVALVLAAAVSVLVGGLGPGARAAPGEADLAYTVGIGDVLLISVWQNPDLSVTVPVRPDGNISVPLVGDVDVVGKTPMVVRGQLIERYKEFVTTPVVSVVVNEVNSREVFILGEIQSAGVYQLLRPTRLMQLVAMAGGLTEFAKKDEIVLLREQESGPVRRVISFKDIQSGRRLEDNIFVQPGDTIIVP